MTTELNSHTLPGTLRDRSLQADRLGGIAAWGVDTGQHVALWDVLDQQWTNPIPRDLARSYQDRRVLLCSGCNFTCLDEELMLPSGEWIPTLSARRRLGEHVQQMRDRGKKHTGAEIAMTVVNDRPVRLCTGCNTAFIENPHRAMEHLREVEEGTVRHAGAIEGLLLYRFSMRPSEPVVLERIAIASGLEGTPVERSQAPRVAKRKRRRNRSRR